MNAEQGELAGLVIGGTFLVGFLVAAILGMTGTIDDVAVWILGWAG